MGGSGDCAGRCRGPWLGWDGWFCGVDEYAWLFGVLLCAVDGLGWRWGLCGAGGGTGLCGVILRDGVGIWRCCGMVGWAYALSQKPTADWKRPLAESWPKFVPRAMMLPSGLRMIQVKR